MRCLTYTFVGLLLTLNIFGEEPIKVKQLLTDHIEPIEISAQLFNISPRLIASVIYTERTLNVNWMEGELDMLLAKSGYSRVVPSGLDKSKFILLNGLKKNCTIPQVNIS